MEDEFSLEWSRVAAVKELQGMGASSGALRRDQAVRVVLG